MDSLNTVYDDLGSGSPRAAVTPHGWRVHVTCSGFVPVASVQLLIGTSAFLSSFSTGSSVGGFFAQPEQAHVFARRASRDTRLVVRSHTTTRSRPPHESELGRRDSLRRYSGRLSASGRRRSPLYDFGGFGGRRRRNIIRRTDPTKNPRAHPRAIESVHEVPRRSIGSVRGLAFPTIPLGTTPATYYILGRVDVSQELIEGNEANNLKAKALAVTPLLMHRTVQSGHRRIAAQRRAYAPRAE